MTFEFERRIGSLTEPERLHFYEVLAHNLTVTIRGIWSETALTDAEKVDRMRWTNEILHRVTAKVWHVRLYEPWSEADFADVIQGGIAKNPVIGGGIEAAIIASYRVVAWQKLEG